MQYKKIMILTIILVSLLAVSSVSAVENATDNIISTDIDSEDFISLEEIDNEVISVEENNQVIELVNEEFNVSNVNMDSSFNLKSDFSNGQKDLIVSSSIDVNSTEKVIIPITFKDMYDVYDINENNLTMWISYNENEIIKTIDDFELNDNTIIFNYILEVTTATLNIKYSEGNEIYSKKVTLNRIYNVNVDVIKDETEYKSGNFIFKLTDIDDGAAIINKTVVLKYKIKAGSITFVETTTAETNEQGIVSFNNSNMVTNVPYSMGYSVSALPVGIHDVTLSSSGLKIINSAQKVSIKVATIDIKIDDFKEPYATNNNVTITVTNKKTGTPVKYEYLHLNIPQTTGKDYYFMTDKNGQIKIDVSKLFTGSYSIIVSINDTKNIEEEISVEKIITIPRGVSKILINSTDPITSICGQEIRFVVNVISNNTPINEGNVSFYVDDKFIGDASVIEGVATLTYTPITDGQHMIVAKFTSENYDDSNDTAILSVAKGKVDLSIDSINSVYFSNPSNFTVNVISNSKTVNEGTIKYFINNQLIGTSNVFNGISKFAYAINTTGSFDLLVVYNETDRYLAKNASATFYVNKMPTTLTGDTVFFDEDQSKTYSTNLKDDNANGVSNQTVKIEAIKYSGESRTFTGISNGSGITIYDVGDLEGGMWIIRGIYNGNNNYIASTFSDKFIVIRMNTTTEIEEIQNAQVNHNYKLKANIHDENGKLVKDGILQFYLDGVDIGSIDLSKDQGHQSALKEGVLGAVNPMFEYELGADGEVSDLYLNYVPTKSGTHTLTAVYEGTDMYRSSNSTTTFEVANSSTKETVIYAENVKTVYNGDQKIVILLKDVNGNKLDGVKVTVVFSNGYKVTPTVVNGKVKVSTNGLKPVKKYTATITFDGNAKYEKSTTKVSVKVYKATPKITAKAQKFKRSDKKKKYTIRLLTNQNIKMKYTKVYIKVNGVKYSAQTNKKGYATFSLKKLTKKGTYKAKITFGGNSYYNALTTKVKIAVK